MKKIVSFDFDATLSRLDVQDYCKELIKRDVEVHITTSRFDELHKEMWPSHPTNVDLWKVVDEINIPRENVHFMNFINCKYQYLKNTKVAWHLDDDRIEIEKFKNALYPPFAVLVEREDWKIKCEKYLQN